MNKVPRWVFRYVGNKTFDFSSNKKGFFAQKRPNLAQNWHFWSIWARPCRLTQCPVGGSVGGCGAQAVSRKTPIYFILLTTLSSSGHSDITCITSFAYLNYFHSLPALIAFIVLLALLTILAMLAILAILAILA